MSTSRGRIGSGTNVQRAYRRFFSIPLVAELRYRFTEGPHRRNYRFGAAVFLMTTAVVVAQLPAAAGTTNLNPNGDFSVNWLVNGTGDSSCAAAHCDLVDDGSTTPNTANYISTGTNGSGGEVDEFDMQTFAFPPGVTTVSSIDVSIYAQSATNANGGSLDTVSINLFIAGAYRTAVAVTPAFNTWGWHTATFTGSWTQADIDAMRVQLTHNNVGTGPSGDRDDDVRIATVYSTATYPTPVVFNQSAYRWFANWDGATPGVRQSNPTTGTDAAYVTVADGTHLYSAGYGSLNGFDWRVEKRNLSDGALVPAFGVSGVLDINVSANDDRIWGIDQDASYIYVAGQDASVSNTDTQWRIEKRDKTTGALVSGFGTGGVVQLNPTSGLDSPKLIKQDGSFIYIVGYDNTGAGQWRIEKRDKTTGALVSGFGTGGVVVRDFAATLNDEATSLAIDGDNLYVGGFDRTTGSSNSQWRIEKRDKTTGALVSGFGSGGVVTENPFTGNAGSVIEDGVVHQGLVVAGGYLYATGSQGVSGSTDMQWRTEKRDLTTGALVTGFGVNGVVNSDPGTGIDNPTAIQSDGSSIFVGGFDRTLDGGMSQWRIEKRDMTSGALVTGFGSSGFITSNPSTNHDELRSMQVVGGKVKAIGYDVVPGNYQWRLESRSSTTGSLGSALASQDTAITAPAQGTPFRLRLLVDVTSNPLSINSQTFKLQYATRSGACDTSFAGEAYSDVSTTAGAIRYYNNPTPANATTTNSIADDPKHSTHTTVAQTYVEAASFSNAAAAIAIDQDGLWDVSLVDYSANPGTTYCFRVVKGDGSVLNGYTAVPEVTTAAVESGVQFRDDHSTVVPTGSTVVAGATSKLFLDFFSVVGGTSETVTPELEIQNVGSAFTGTPNYSGDKESTSLSVGNRRFAPCSAYDSTAKRMVVFGGRGNDGTTHFNDAWALEMPKNSQPRWTQLTAQGAGGSPEARRSCAAAYDSTNNRFLVWNGWNGTSNYNDVWSLSLGATPTWTRLCDATSCGTSPAAKRSGRMVYDPVNNQLIVFGGYTSTYTNDMWKLSLGASPAWTQLSPTGGPPQARSGHSQVYDPVNHLMWVFAGTISGADLNDTWKYDIAANTWTQVFANGCASCPTKTDGGTMVYDSANRRMVAFGGYDSATPKYLNSFSILSNLDTTPAWTTPTPPSVSPFARYYHTAVYDPENQRMVVYAGFNSATSSISMDSSALYLPTDGSTPYWRGVASKNVMNPRDQVAAYYDAANSYAYIFGGFGDGTLPGSNTSGGHQDSTLRLDARQGRQPRWRDVASQPQNGSVPLKREATMYATDTSRNRMMFFGGLTGEDGYLNDVWVADMPTSGEDPVWKQLCSPTSCGTAPSGRWAGTAVYDKTGDRLIVFGGRQNSGTNFNDVWALSLSGSPTWTQLTPTGTAPAARWGGAAVYDQVNNRMVTWGGQSGADATPTNYNDTFALSLGGSPAWSQLTPTGTAPSARRSMAYTLATASTDKMVVFGGYDAVGAVHYNDVFTLDLSTINGAWSNPFPNDCANSVAPKCQRSTSAVYDQVNNRMIVLTGRDASLFYDTTYAFSLTGNTWSNMSPANEIRFSVPVSGLAEASYHWQYRTNASSTGIGAFRSYGSNSDTVTAATDFTYCDIPGPGKRLRHGAFFCSQAKQYNYLGQ